MNWKLIFFAAAALAAVYYGSDRLKQRGILSEQLQAEPYIKDTVGQFVDFSMKRSKDAPMCDDECKNINRYLFVMKGEKTTLQLAADYNKVTRRVSHRVYCDEAGKPVMVDSGMSILNCR